MRNENLSRTRVEPCLRAGDWNQRVEDLIALEQVLKDLDGANGINVEVGENQCTVVTAQRLEKFLSQVRDKHVRRRNPRD